MSLSSPLVLPEDHPHRFSVASIIVGRELARRDRKSERRSRKLRALEHRLSALRVAAPDGPTFTDLSAVKLETALTEEQAATLAVDLVFSEPFAPYELRYSERDFAKALRRSAPEVRLDETLVDRVLTLKGEAMRAHTGLFTSRWRLVLAGASSAAMLPFIPAFVGAAAGVALTTQGVALLQAGSLAAASSQLAAGGWLVTGIQSAASSSARAGARKLVNVAPASAVRVEVAKWQTWAALRMLEDDWSRAEIAAQLEKLEELEMDINDHLAEERTLNDRGACRLRELEAKARAVAIGRSWIAERRASQ